jgi:hypothetical protein
LERATILNEGALIDADHLTPQPGANSSRNDTIDLSALERSTIAKVLQECGGNETKAGAAAWVVPHTAPPAGRRGR